MSKIELPKQCASIFLLVMVTIAGAMDNACYKPPTPNYSTLMSCCKESTITYSEEVMAQCRDIPSNRTRNLNNTDLVLMNFCEINCYLNYSGIIENDGTIQQERLIDFLEGCLTNDEIKAILPSFVDKCLLEVNFEETNEHYGPNCQPCYAMLIDCIQGEIYTKCPDSAMNSSEMCSINRFYIESCTASILRKLFGHTTKVINVSDSDDNIDSLYSDYHGTITSSSSSESESDDSGSDYEAETEIPLIPLPETTLSTRQAS